MLTTAQLLTLADRRHSQEGEIGSIQAREGRMSIRPWAAGNVTREKGFARASSMRARIACWSPISRWRTWPSRAVVI